MKVAVIIPTIGRPELDDALESLRHQTRTPDELIVMHDTERRGAAATRNEAARRTHADILLFMDDDCIAAPTWVDRMCTAFADPTVAAVSGSVIYRTNDHTPTYEERVVQNKNAQWFMGANCGVRREAFWKLGGFPEKYRVYEDKAFALACWMKQYRVACAPTAQVYHALSRWDEKKVIDFTDHLSWWIELMRDYDVWADKNNPPPLWAGHVLMPRDFVSFLKHRVRFHDPASQLHARLLLRQRIHLWKRAMKQKMFIL